MTVMNRPLILLVFAAVLSAAGCGYPPSQYVRQPDMGKQIDDQAKARVIVIGDPMFAQPASHMTRIWVTANGVQIGTIKGHSYLCWETESGVIDLTARVGNESPSSVTLLADKEKTYYFTVTARPTNFTPVASMKAVLEPVEIEKGKGKMEGADPPKLENSSTGKAQ